MALAMRGKADRAEFIRYTESLEVPSSWREGPLKISLGGDISNEAAQTVVVTTKKKFRAQATKQAARPSAKPVIKVDVKKPGARKDMINRGAHMRHTPKGKKVIVEAE